MIMVRLNFNVFACISVVFVALSCKKPDKYLKEAEKLEKQGKYEQAIKQLDKAIEIDEMNVSAFMSRGADKAALGMHEEAIKDYEKVLEIDENNIMAQYNIANNYKGLENWHEALKHLNRCIKAKGGNFLTVDFAPNSILNEKYDVATKFILYQRGECYYRLDSLQLALGDFVNSLNQGYSRVDCLYWIAHTYLAGKQDSMACEYFNLCQQTGDKQCLEDFNKYCRADSTVR